MTLISFIKKKKKNHMHYSVSLTDLFIYKKFDETNVIKINSFKYHQFC